MVNYKNLVAVLKSKTISYDPTFLRSSEAHRSGTVYATPCFHFPPYTESNTDIELTKLRNYLR